MAVAKFATTTRHGAMEGKTQTRLADFYNLDVIISVGYRVKSKRGVEFRRWANSILKQYVTIIATTIINKTIQDILRKYLNSLSDNGFSGVSSGQRMKIITTEIKVMINSMVLKSCIFDNLIIPVETNIERVDSISHLVSVAA